MKLQKSAEDYLETIYILQQRKGSVRSIDIATELRFSKPSVSRAMKLLRENDYITMQDDGFIALTPTGQTVAARMYERHTLLENFLQSLGVAENAAREDACRIEHVISEESFARLKEFVAAHTK